jgi:hypothetical protein
LVLSLSEAEIDLDNPIIGWENLVDVSNISSGNPTTGAAVENTNFPTINLANTSSYLRFQQLTPGEAIFLQANFDGSRPIDYLGLAGHNFGSSARALSLYGATDLVNNAFLRLLLHMDGTDASTSFVDSSPTPKTFTSPSGSNAQIDTAQSKFGGASGLFDGVGDYITTPDHADFALGSSDFTIDCWFRVNDAGGTTLNLAGQCDNAATATTISFNIRRRPTNTIRATVNVGSTAFNCDGALGFTNALNPGWHHLAFVRTGSTLKLFIDGVQDGTVAVTGSVNDSANELAVGRNGETPGSEWNGWIDEFCIRVGTAKWTSNFSPPVFANSNPGSPEFFLLTSELIVADNTPLLFRFSVANYNAIRIVATSTSGLDTAYAAVMFVGKLLVMERKLQVTFTPLPYGRKSDIVGSRAERGQFLGRVIVGAWVESTANFMYLSPDWYRDNMDAFLEASQTEPFFFAWAPVSYPFEVGYAWAMDVPTPQIHNPIGIIQVTIPMQGIVE